jgi:hypothetical protein
LKILCGEHPVFAEKKKPRAKVKRCHLGRRCPPVWTCRGCGAKCCEHLCGLKLPDGTARCARCFLL